MLARYCGLLWLTVFALGIVALLPITRFSFAAPVPDWQGGLFTTLSYSAGHQGFLLTLLIQLVWCFHDQKQNKDLKYSLLALAVMLGAAFLLKTGLKELIQSPRPYVQWLVDQHFLISTEQFYQLSQAMQTELIQQANQQMSTWRSIHWQGEMDFSFPSGHTVFASICIAFFGGEFLKRKRYISASLLLLWGLGVTTSRLWIGMHRPVDLFGAVFTVFVIYALVQSVSAHFKPKQ